MKPNLPPVSPLEFHPSQFESPLEGRLKLPDGRVVGEVCSDLAYVDEYCHANYGDSWWTLRCHALEDLAARLFAISGRIPALDALLRAGQPVETLSDAYNAIYDSLMSVYADGSLQALLMAGKLSLEVGERFPPLATSGKGVETIEMSAQLGNAAAYCVLGDHYLSGRRVDAAIREYEKGAALKCSACVYQLGQLAEHGLISEDSGRSAYDFYLFASAENYPPATVALARLWLKNPNEHSRPPNLVQSLIDCAEMRCERAELTLAEVYVLDGRYAEVMKRVLSLTRCAAVYGEVEAQLKLAAFLSGGAAGELNIQADVEEAERWYLRALEADSASQDQKAQASFELAQLFMKCGKYDQAAHHFLGASSVYPEAAALQDKCERFAEAQFFSRDQSAFD
ncbi:hypothetical protein [Pseudomonas putida]|uniref:hypothetical protein n=1 Tax=Pseudomonas putida TaxID=303 RepID=UPI003906096B